MRLALTHDAFARNERLWNRAGLIGALLVGALLRLHHLGTESLWLDEAFAVDLARSSLARIVTETAKDVHPPLYYLLLHYWVRAFGGSEVAVRLMSVVASVGALAMLFALVARLFGERTAAWAACLAAITPFQLEFAQEARMYALLSLLSVASLWAFVALVETGRPRFVAWLAVFTALMLYTHAYAAFVFLAEAMAVLVLARGTAVLRQHLRLSALGLALAVVLFLPWLPISMRQVFHVQRGFWIPDPTAGGLVDAMVLYCGSVPLAWLCSALVVIALVVGLRRATSSRAPSGITLPIVGFWLLCPTILPFALSHVSSPIFLPKYTIAGSLALLTLAARAIAIMPQRIVRVGFGVVIASCLWVPLAGYYDVARKVDWRDAIAGVNQSAKAGDVVFFNSSYARFPFDYYSTRPGLIRVPFLRDHDVLTNTALRDYVAYHAGGHTRVWVVLSNADDLSSILITELRRDRVIAAHSVEWGIEIYRFDCNDTKAMVTHRSVPPPSPPAVPVKITNGETGLEPHPTSHPVW